MKSLLYIFTIVLITNLGASATDEQKKSFKTECSKGDTLSCYNMGLMYDYGDGSTAEDDNKAIGFYLKACDKNFYESCSKAALLYEEGKNVKQDMKKAFKLYSKACGGEDGFACHNVAVYYSKMKTEALKKISIAFYDKACNAGYSESCIYLGRMYRDSRSVKRDLQKAKEKFDLACEANNYLGCKELRILEELERAGY
ncbi:tetratricopeptide repeat protein [Sulfurimonas sp.]|uniref:tetratricopeptide repeat protein n=1 Tax=Sulfurimonas sp. TaxID=2022749 RepID=UPI0035649204